MSFFDYKWNNFLHAQLVDIIKNCLSSELNAKTGDENTKNNNDDVAKTADASSTETTTETPPTESSPSTFIQHV